MRELDNLRNPLVYLVKKYPGWEWDMEELSRNPSITPEFIDAHSDWKWDIRGLSHNTSITPEFVEAHPDWEWSMNGLSQNPSITPEFIEAHLDWEWDMIGLSQNTFDSRYIKNKIKAIEEAAARRIWYWWVEQWYRPGKGGMLKSMKAIEELYV